MIIYYRIHRYDYQVGQEIRCTGQSIERPVPFDPLDAQNDVSIQGKHEQYEFIY
jgi:hypothetical protein